jgi:hypothetical protein
VPLSEDEQRILQQIEQQFHVTDPEFAGEIEKHTLYSHYLRLLKWAGVAFVACVLILVVALATETTFVVAFLAFLGMLGCALWFERSLRKLGKAGLEQLTQSMRAAGLRDSFGSAGQRMRDRFHREDEQ